MKKSAQEFLKETGYKKICTCSSRGNKIYCDDMDCDQLPDKQELLEELKDYAIIFSMDNQSKKLSNVLMETIRYIQATPLHITNKVGHRLCTCEQKNNINFYTNPELAQAAQDDNTEAHTLPMPSLRQIQKFFELLPKASFRQRRAILKVLPDIKKVATKLLHILITNR